MSTSTGFLIRTDGTAETVEVTSTSQGHLAHMRDLIGAQYVDVIGINVFGTPFGKRGSDDRVAVGRVSDSGVHPSDRLAAMALPWRGVVSCSGRRGR